MAETEKPNWGNRIILLIFGALAVITIGATIVATMNEWGEGDVAGATAVEDLSTIDPGTDPTSETPDEIQDAQ
ncbi:hypothetical protein [Pelagibacterium halotolerans]|uniref:Uncharacterized protein n=1 Tax=Pelagibacterium halotolerans (strain DSM 22347 / JCM 15775 / CGMCC 1.7692 / B2) TaxID=1082931 RepID=G4R925_PELHB|nr:hypothetical protein [Pelagibacterium halotolerans]AEQ52405.1 hypothetical protein KKY_2397 [Pelagibacterium halotolerans B2]QJR17864.1 hypothetical protein HKM20_05065 [Pelagibacterium halotolerans]SEA35440.1 hypothetical protein SAMN05428936_103144 [Pelagibacterium halotolerans]